MTLTAVYFATLLAGGASVQQDSTLLLQSGVAKVKGSGMFWNQFGSTFVEGSFGVVPESAPTWCKNETQLTWKQRKERMEQHLTLEWAKKMVKQMLEQNETVPEWMDKIVSDDEQRGKTKWAVQESKRLKSEGKEIPAWMDELVQEDTKWANRWAACKAAELKEAGEEVPEWMVENGRKGILDAAAEKAAELQGEIEEIEEERDREAALVDAHGDVQTANNRMLARKRDFSTMTVSSQFRALEQALDELDAAEAEMLNGHMENGPTRRFKRALRLAKSQTQLLGKLLERKADMMKAEMSAAQ